MLPWFLQLIFFFTHLEKIFLTAVLFWCEAKFATCNFICREYILAQIVVLHRLHQYTTIQLHKRKYLKTLPTLWGTFTPNNYSHSAVCLSVYLTSLQPICWRSSCLSVSELRGRMFFSSSSFLLGRFPSLMFKVSRRRIFMAKEPKTKLKHIEASQDYKT